MNDRWASNISEPQHRYSPNRLQEGTWCVEATASFVLLNPSYLPRQSTRPGPSVSVASHLHPERADITPSNARTAASDRNTVLRPFQVALPPIIRPQLWTIIRLQVGGHLPRRAVAPCGPGTERPFAFYLRTACALIIWRRPDKQAVGGFGQSAFLRLVARRACCYPAMALWDTTQIGVRRGSVVLQGAPKW